MSAWTLDPEYAVGEAGKAFVDLDAVFAQQGKQITRDSLSEVLYVQLDGRGYYVKRYWAEGGYVRRVISRPRIKGEWQNLLYFRDWGIPVARVVGYGMERRAGAFHRGAVITEELYETQDLAQLASTGDVRLRDRSWVTQVMQQIADATRTMHQRRFAHNDLKWRNILVNDAPRPSVYMIDCPTGAFWWGPFLEHRKNKDLACLDKLGKTQLSRTQRLRFYLMYVERSRLQSADKKRIRLVLGHMDRRPHK